MGSSSGTARLFAVATFIVLLALDAESDHRQFKQRYYEFLDYFRAPNGPVFLYICGEATCSGISNSYLAVMAKKFGAALVSPEHRYYGKSSPFESLTTENLRFLSSKQALFDLAVFRQYYQETLNAKYNRTGADNSWFVFGGSYAGALSAWFRLKFPHLTCGSLASSGVVLAVHNFTDFDKQIGDSAGPECKEALQEVTRLVDRQLQSGRNSVKQLFGASTLENDGDFLYLLADAAAIAFQYGNPDVLCSPLVEAKKNGTDLVVSLGFVLECLWYHLDLCRNVFGEGVYPDVFMTNLYYGGTRIAGDSSKCSPPEALNKVRKKIEGHIDLWLSECQEQGHDKEPSMGNRWNIATI
ncbi:hypothetical protein PR202_gb07181 [Eleusine coracana subsp. coracana]|uniref:Serine protease EDA2 n=1 Tax=Eleusine coracana subsp. coracana TaxID=191504 RepID=A0AAV5EBF0_ELECO|nr:hypothetical protein PR202_gb07181 [Eleusine coracana subsp. coracana]